MPKIVQYVPVLAYFFRLGSGYIDKPIRLDEKMACQICYLVVSFFYVKEHNWNSKFQLANLAVQASVAHLYQWGKIDD